MLRSLIKTMGIKENIIGQMQSRFSPMSTTKFDVETNRIVWVDLEMTGLDVEKDTIMEVACIVTDQELNIIAEAPELVVNHSLNTLDNMSEWCRKQHGKSGLTDACLQSKLDITQVEDKLLEFLSQHVTEKVSPLAGNSVYMDRLFIRKYMSRIHEFLHYRIIDVSTIKELCRRWNVNLYRTVPKKGLSHRAVADIRESIEELKFYKNNFFKLAQ